MAQQHSLRARPAVPVASSAELVWQHVTQGRLRIVDWYDHGGRRYVVTRPTGAESAALSERQQRALALRAAGVALKVVAFELGVSLSTAARDVESAMARLGLKSQGDLAAVLGHARV